MDGEGWLLTGVPTSTAQTTEDGTSTYVLSLPTKKATFDDGLLCSIEQQATPFTFTIVVPPSTIQETTIITAQQFQPEIVQFYDPDLFHQHPDQDVVPEEFTSTNPASVRYCAAQHTTGDDPNDRFWTNLGDSMSDWTSPFMQFDRDGTYKIHIYFMAHASALMGDEICQNQEQYMGMDHRTELANCPYCVHSHDLLDARGFQTLQYNLYMAFEWKGPGGQHWTEWGRTYVEIQYVCPFERIRQDSERMFLFRAQEGTQLPTLLDTALEDSGPEVDVEVGGALVDSRFSIEYVGNEWDNDQLPCPGRTGTH
jgi:hypothetical protein